MAILGILMVNIQTFAMIDIVQDNPAATGDLTGANRHIWHLMHVFFEGKFHSIFAALFGAGILLMTERAARGAVSPRSLHIRLTGARSTRFYFATAFLAGIPGLALAEIGVQLRIASEWDPLFHSAYGHQFNYWGSLPAALAWVSVGVLVARARLLARLASALAAVGRMALTNYLMQSLICTWIFYGHGLGWYGQTNRTTQLLIVFAVWILQLAVSPLWLRWFRFGPVEYLWRWATYRQRPRMRVRPQRAVDAPAPL